MSQKFQKEIDRDRLERIKRFVYFTNINLDKIDLGERVKWTTFCLDELCQTNELEKKLTEWLKEDKLRKCQTALIVLLNKILRGKGETSIIPDVGISLMVKMEPDVPVDDWKLHLAYETPYDELSLVLVFHSLLDHFPTEYFKKCKGCENNFVSTNKRRIYCTNNCAAKTISRKVRERKKCT